MEEVVSIVLPVYNSEKYLEETIKSILNQSYENFELLIIDDKSTDLSFEIANGFEEKDNRVKFIRLQENGGAAFARNTGMNWAKGKIIVFIDSDDVMLPNRLKKTVEVFDSRPGIDIVFSNSILIDGEGEELGRDYYFPPYLINDNILLHELKRNYLLGTTLSIRDSIAKEYSFDIDLRTAEDYDFFLKLLYDGHKYYYVKESLIKYRVHSANKSSIKANSINATKYILNKYNFEDLYDKLKEKGCKDRDIYNSFAVVSIIKEDYSTAKEYIDKALVTGNDFKEDVFESLFYGGVIYYKLNLLSDSFKYFNEALLINKDEPTILNNLGVIYYQKGEINTARQFLEKSLQVKPGYIDAQTNLESLKSEENPDRITEKILRKKLVHTGNYKL